MVILVVQDKSRRERFCVPDSNTAIFAPARDRLAIWRPDRTRDGVFVTSEHRETFSVVGVPEADGLVFGRRSDESSAGRPGDASDGSLMSATNAPQPHPRHRLLAHLHAVGFVNLGDYESAFRLPSSLPFGFFAIRMLFFNRRGRGDAEKVIVSATSAVLRSLRSKSDVPKAEGI